MAGIMVSVTVVKFVLMVCARSTKLWGHCDVITNSVECRVSSVVSSFTGGLIYWSHPRKIVGGTIVLRYSYWSLRLLCGLGTSSAGHRVKRSRGILKGILNGDYFVMVQGITNTFWDLLE
ncbi:hypothetical protein OIU85_023904 [Salix viminalis]|uniref:Secreted protein n=1 Tax=Salix viminalis TaxID=40686 RepID=A0A9Q0TZN8_SALVM|nr:hypothetical protein OIU85_023904 [Salix viminalis]